MIKKSVPIIAALIGGAAVVIAALVTSGFGLLKPSGTSTKVQTGNNNTGPLMVMGASRDVTINYNIPDTETKEAIRALETKLKGSAVISDVSCLNVVEARIGLAVFRSGEDAIDVVVRSAVRSRGRQRFGYEGPPIDEPPLDHEDNVGIPDRR